MRNEPAPVEVWRAAACWLRRHDPCRSMDREDKVAPLDAAVSRKLWRPYWLAKRRIPSWLPLRPSRQALTHL